MFYGYHRVSTKEQNLERGIKGIEDFCKSRNYKLEKVFVDKMSGRTVDRTRYTVLKEDVLLAMKERGEWDNYGRHRVMSLPDFEKEYQNVKDGKIKSLELMRKLNMKKSTYFKYVREIKLMNSTD